MRQIGWVVEGRFFLLIVAFSRNEDETKIRTGEGTCGTGYQGHSSCDTAALSAEEKIRIVLEGLRGAELCSSTPPVINQHISR
jgi:hypothetical protein